MSDCGLNVTRAHKMSGPGTVEKDGVCVPAWYSETKSGGGGCLIATAAYGTEIAPQVQLLREIRDNAVFRTSSGTTFMTSFNEFYYSFSPQLRIGNYKIRYSRK